MYCKHFGFEQFPFSITPDPEFFYINADVEEVLSRLACEIKRGNSFAVVTGEAGTGKTTLLRRLIDDLPEHAHCAFVIIKARLSFVALLRSILTELGIFTTATDRESLIEQLRNCVQTEFTKGGSVALIFDEAQSMTDEVLAQISSLRDLDKAMSIVLMGHADLEPRLRNANLRSLNERVTLTQRLARLKNADVGLYITSKLEHAGLKRDVFFEPGAIEKIAKLSNGIPRLINAICDNALLLAYRASASTVTAEMIEQVAINFHLGEHLPNTAPKSPGEMTQRRNLERAFSVNASDAGETAADCENGVNSKQAPAMQQAKKSGWQKNQFVNLGRFRRAIGASAIAVGLVSSFVAFYSRPRDARVPSASVDVRSSHPASIVTSTPVEPMPAENKAVAMAAPQPASMFVPASTVDQQRENQIDTAGAHAQNHAEVPNVGRPSHAASQQIYQVVGASFVRNRPAANADIIETLQPGIRVAILSRTGEYIHVRSLDDATVLGFVHREDAFFERIQ
jgi:type II secretory pathway predicted ATPase ExeA